MTLIEKSLTYQDLALDVQEIYKAMGYKTDALPDEKTRQEVAFILEEIAQNLLAKFRFVTEGIETFNRFSPGKIILSQLKGSQAICFFVATAGEWFEQYQQALMKQGDMLRVYIANEIGSLLAEKVADCMEQCLEAQIEPKGLHHTNRFSPGYCGWALTEQKMLFNHLRIASYEMPCGISLNDSCLMQPIKSVSGVIGIGKDVKKHDYKCNVCGLESCYKRSVH